MTPDSNTIICGDCLEVVPKLPRAKMIFADVPDNLGAKYKGFTDKWPSETAYLNWLKMVISVGANYSEIFWLSYYHRYQPTILNFAANNLHAIRGWRQFVWRFTFGQHRNTDFANGYRPILRLMAIDAEIYPDAVRVESQRQRNKDKRANPNGRIPDDVWDFSRVCGTFGERRQWHPNQHPEALIERIIKFSTKEGDLVIDMFGGTGTTLRVCQRLNRRCIIIEISPYYCQKISEETGVKIS